MMDILVIGYGEDGERTGGAVFLGVKNDREAVAKALDFVRNNGDIAGWNAYELLGTWGPGRTIEPIDSDYH